MPTSTKKKSLAKKGLLVIVSGPSGVGKSTVMSQLLKRATFLQFSISYTTRPPRTGEVNAKHYVFVDKEEFSRRIKAGEFLEWAKVHSHYYGTDRGFVEAELAKNRVVVLEVDVQGADQVRELIRKLEFRVSAVVFIFLIPPSVDILSTRLEGRKTETKEIIEQRLRAAMNELQLMEKYDYIVVNDEVASAAQKIEVIIHGELERKLLN